MGSLEKFRKYLKEKERLLSGVQKRLQGMLENYENHLAEVSKAREAELGQLARLIADRADGVPEDFLRKIEVERERQKRLLDQKIGTLRKKRQQLLDKAEELRTKSLDAERKLKKQNSALDAEEEKLKARSRALMAEVEEHNRKIREMGKGFGFFKNLPAMRRLQHEKERLEQELEDLGARIEKLRARWRELSEGHAEDERKRRTEWVRLETEADAVGAKIEHLEQNSERIVDRSALEAVLLELEAPVLDPAPDDPECPRCGTRNCRKNHFCMACAARLGEDRPDFAGSIEEVAELNHHHRRFTKGLAVCQEAVALVRGVTSGLRAMLKSVEEMIYSQNRYGLAPLRIDVPAECVEFGKVFDELDEKVKDAQGIHPLKVAEALEPIVKERLGEQQLKKWFERMGEELNRRASAQW
ncbi:MAG: hypothetical protein D6806_01240 [Deltaproteobacteria bacterium]|nr:MAG: hypothetical protein D6806_01240 [Deltaproteobacteria bacterium]